MKAGHAAVVMTAGMLLLGASLPLVAVSIALALVAAQLPASSMLWLVPLLPLFALGLWASYQLMGLHSAGMRDEGFSGHGSVYSLADLVRKLLMHADLDASENHHVSKHILIVHKSTRPHTATNHAAPTSGRVVRYARLLLGCIVVQIALQLGGALLLLWGPVASDSLPLPALAAWMLVL